MTNQRQTLRAARKIIREHEVTKSMRDFYKAVARQKNILFEIYKALNIKPAQ
jgi:hypothetical protein